MNQQEFTARYEADWDAFDRMLEVLERGRRRAKDAENIAEFPLLYRRLCQQLALARDRDYAAHLVDRLNQLVLRGHQYLYDARAGVWSRLVRAVVVDIPVQVRAEAKVFWLAAVLLFGPTVGITLAVMQSPELVYSIMPAAQVDRFEDMYRPESEALGRERDSDTDFLMFGYYIRNNIGVGFRTFAGGLLYGIGTVFFLVFNGIHFGAVAGHLSNVGYAETFFSFVVGHGAFELTAIVLAGMAGLKLGWSLIAPGRLSRLRSLQEASLASINIVYAVIVMLVMAAFVEAFWSSSASISSAMKFWMGGLLWLLVCVYFLLMGRRRGPG